MGLVLRSLGINYRYPKIDKTNIFTCQIRVGSFKVKHFICQWVTNLIPKNVFVGIEFINGNLHVSFHDTYGNELRTSLNYISTSKFKKANFNEGLKKRNRVVDRVMNSNILFVILCAYFL